MKTKICPIDCLTKEQVLTLAQDLQAGAVAVVPTDTVYGLATSAFNEPAIARIYQIKQRPAGVALQLLIGSIEQAQQITQWTPQAQQLAQAFWPGGLTLILRPNQKGEILRRGFEGLGLRLPDHKGLLQVLQTCSGPLACTSANLHGQPVITQEEKLKEFFDGKVEWILTAGNLTASASSVLDITREPVLLRGGAVSRHALEEILHTSIK